jgi:probable F420-dependent oxidoreductase
MKIGLMLPIGEREDGTSASWGELREMALHAEAGGLDSVWLPDHLLFRAEDGRSEPTRGLHEAWTTLTAVAVSTSRIEIGPLVLAMPFRNPALLAKMAVELDGVSGGRLILGVGCGWHRPEFDAFGYPFDHRVSRFDEALQILVPLLREGRVTFRGRYHVAQDAELRPFGPRPGRIPLLIAGKGARMLSLVARYANAWNAAWYGPLDQAGELEQRLEALEAALAAAGRDPATLDVTVGLFVHFPNLPGTERAPSSAIRGAAEEVARELAAYAERGVKHVIVHIWPRSPAAVDQLAGATALARERIAEEDAIQVSP